MILIDIVGSLATKEHLMRDFRASPVCIQSQHLPLLGVRKSQKIREDNRLNVVLKSYSVRL